jgi:methylated-DNA-protein-cysteine methyltransferase related protein
MGSRMREFRARRSEPVASNQRRACEILPPVVSTLTPPTRQAEHLAAQRDERVLERVRAIPPGFVRTYGDCSPGSPRHAGAVLAAVPAEAAPWHRVVRADGSLAKGARQRALLEAEGVPFRGARVDMRIARMVEPR